MLLHFFRSLAFLLAIIVAVNTGSAESHRSILPIDLANIRDIGGHHSGAISTSRDGRYVAFQLQWPDIANRNYKLTWYVAETKEGGDIWPVGDGGELILNPEMRWSTNGNRPPIAPLWSPDGTWIIYLKRSESETQIWRSRRDGSIQEQLTHTKGGVLSATFDSDAPPSFKFIDNSTLVFAVARDPEIIVNQVQKEGDVGFLYDNRFLPGMMEVSPSLRLCDPNAVGGNKFVRRSRACEPKKRIYDFENSLEREATKDEIANYNSSADIPERLANRDVRLFREADGGNKLAWLENENPKRYPGATAPVRLFASINGIEYRCDALQCEAYSGVIEGIWWQPGTSEVILQRADGSNKSTTGLYVWTPGSSDVHTILQTEDKLEDCDVYEARAICLRETWTHPRTIISLDLSTGEMQTIYDPNPEFNNIQFSKVEKIEWKDGFGCATHGHLVYPLNYQEGHRYPLVITTYRSRGFLRGAMGDEYPIHLLAANGFMVLSHDKPRCYERFATFASWGRAEFEDLYERRSSLSAQKLILEMLDNRGLIDLQRTAITGLSDGADQVMFALIHTNRFTTGITNGAFDYRAFYYLSNKVWRSHWEQTFGGPPDEDENGYWRALSLGRNVHLVDEPLLANVSDRELLFSVENISRLAEADRAVEMYVFPNEYHIKWQPQHRLAIYRRNVQWLKFWLMGEEVNDPVDLDQYARWRTMRGEQCARLKGDDSPSYCHH